MECVLVNDIWGSVPDRGRDCIFHYHLRTNLVSTLLPVHCEPAVLSQVLKRPDSAEIKNVCRCSFMPHMLHGVVLKNRNLVKFRGKILNNSQ
jgi:hypothetical protein